MELNFPEFEGPIAQRGIGIIAPFDLALERELWRWAPMEVSLHLARTPYEPVPVSLEMAELVSDSRHLSTATRDVLHVEPEVVAYLCTSGSFINGLDYERSLSKAICDAGASDAVTTSGALVEVLHQLDLHQVSVLTPYDDDLTDKLHDFLAEACARSRLRPPRTRRRHLEGQLPHHRRADRRRRRSRRGSDLRQLHEPAHLRRHRAARNRARQTRPHREPAHDVGLPAADGPADRRPR